MTPKQIFDKHYRGLVNAATPVVLEYGWLVPDKYAYELARNRAGVFFGLTVLVVSKHGSIKEARHARRFGTETEVRTAMLDLANTLT
jgi:hypothetical protein